MLSGFVCIAASSTRARSQRAAALLSWLIFLHPIYSVKSHRDFSIRNLRGKQVESDTVMGKAVNGEISTVLPR